MAPNPRRPGVDASIVQASTVRGYDSPLPGNPAEDLVVSVGKNTATNAVSKILLWNRTDSNWPLFVLRPGAVLAAAPRFEVFAGTVGDPNAIVTSPIGSIYISNNPAAMWQNQDGLQTWKRISDDLGGESLAQTLAIGNLTGAHDIIVSSGDKITGQSSAIAAGGDLPLLAGSATGPAGAGGSLLLTSGSSQGAASGLISLTTPAGNGANSSGLIQARTGDATGGAASGNLLFATGTSGAGGVGGSAGTISLIGGVSEATGPSTSRGGSLFLRGGRARTDGEGGSINIAAGISSNIAPFFPIPLPQAGRGGSLTLSAGASAAAQTGGGVAILAGAGGSAGGEGGSVFINPGPGGGGGPAGTVQVGGVLTSTNLLRGNGDPNGLIPGDEGYLYQRGDGGQGSVYVNTNGSINGWAKLALAGSLADALTKAQQGFLVPSGSVLVNTDADRIADVGLLKGIRTVLAGGGVFAHGTATPEGGPFLNIRFEGGVGSTSALDMSASLSSKIFALDQNFVASFKFRNSGVNTAQRMFMGYSSNDAVTQLAADAPAVGQYVGLVKSGSSTNWFFVNRGPGNFNLINTTVTSIVTSTAGNPFYYIIDGRDFANGNIRHIFLDKDFAQLATFVASGPGVALPFSSTRLNPVIGGVNIDGANPASLGLFQTAIILKADDLEGGGGGGGGSETLEQTLQFGNTTGTLPIIVSQGSSILGEVDGDGGNGSPLLLSGGQTTVGANNTGPAQLTSANLAIAASSGNTGTVLLSSGSQSGVGSTGSTGTTQVSSGSITDAAAVGSTGLVSLLSGAHSGAGGATGAVRVFSGRHLGAAGTTGDISIAPGSFNANPATPGVLELRGGSTTLNGIAGGAIILRSGENNNIGNSGAVSIRSANIVNTGDAGLITVAGGAGGAVDGRGGSVLIQGGNAASVGLSAFGGTLTLTAGNGTQAGGGVILSAGTSTNQAGPDVTITAGNSVTLGGGNITLNPGTGPGGDGEVIVNGKLTVTGLIDPTGLLLDGQTLIPSTIAVGQGLLWVDSNASPSVLVFTNDLGTDVVLGSGGATSLASLTDVNLVAPVIGEVLTYDGAFWVNLPGSGGSPLATILALGNATGANNIIVNTGQQITAQTDLNLNPGAGPGDRVVLDGLRWPGADGLAGDVLTTDGAGNLIFSPGGGTGGPTFAQALAKLQTGCAVPPASGLSSAVGFGIYNLVEENHAGFFLSVQGLPVGPLSQYGTGAVLNQDCGAYDANYCTNKDRRSLTTWKLGMPSTGAAHRLFVGLTNASTAPDFFNNQLSSDNPGVVHVGIAYSSDLLDVVYRFVIDRNGASFTSAPSTVAAGAFPRHVEVDLVTVDQVTIRILDINGTELDSHTFMVALDASKDLAPTACIRARVAGETRFNLYSMMTINQAYLVGGIGGTGTQTLEQVLFFGNQTGGQAIQGDTNAVGDGGDLEINGGNSTGGGGDGGAVVITGGAADAGGNGKGGDIRLEGAPGALNGQGSDVTMRGGNATGTGAGGFVGMAAGSSASGAPGYVLLLAGTPSAGNVVGGAITLTAAPGSGTANGGGIILSSGAGGAGGGDGGDITVTPGAGAGGGVQGTFVVDGPMHVTGKLTVDGLIDPPGLLMTPSVGAPFTPGVGEGGIWVNLLGDLVYTNEGGDLNLSDLAPTSGIFLDAFMIAGYGFLSPGSTTTTTPQSSGVLGNSSLKDLAVGGTATLSYDSEGPLLSLSTAAAASSHSVIGTQDVFLSRNQKLRTRIKFQPTSVTHTDERLFIGFSTNPVTQIDSDDPVGNQYVGLRKSLAGITLDFVARGAGGAMAPIVAWPIDSAVHYIDLDFTDPSQVRFILYAADAVTVQATATVLTGGTLPAVTTGMSILCGVGTTAGTVRSMDFYSAAVVTRGDLLGAILGGGSGVPATLAQTLLLGNVTGASNIVITTGQGLFGETDLLLNPGAGVGDKVVIDGLRWPDTDGAAGTFLKTDGAGVLSFSTVPAATLAAVLLAGSTTGATSITVSTGQSILGQTNLVLTPGGGGGDKVVIDGLSWPTADGAAGTFLKTDGAGVLSFVSVPADSLSAVLTVGSTTGAHNITVSTGQSILGQTDLTLSPAAGVGNQVVIDGLRWPEADGASGTFLRTNGGGALAFAAVPADTLATTLAAGNTTGANSITVATGQAINGQTDLTLSPGAGVSDKVVIDGLSWPTADGSSGTFLKTDGSGVLSFVAVPADSLSAVLAVGNTTGANSITIATGQAINGQTNLTLSPGAGVSDKVVIDGLSWPTADGSSGNFLRTNGTGTLTFAAVPADTLSAVLVAGNTTGATDLVVTTGQKITSSSSNLLLSGFQSGGSGTPGTCVVSRNTTDVGGSASLLGGDGANTDAGGAVLLTGGQGGGSNGTGGAVTITGGIKGGSGTAGTVLLKSGSATMPTAISQISGAATGDGQIQAVGSTATHTGGGLLLGRGGEITSSGGYALLMGGTGSGGGNIGGQAAVIGGTGVTGGLVSILGGNASAGGGGDGGNVIVAGGTPNGAGAVGVAQLGTTATGFRINGVSQSNATGFRCGSVTINGVASSTTVSFSAMASVPIVVVTPVKTSTATAYSYWVDTITTTSFVIRRNSTADGAVPINWIAVAV